RGGVAGRVDGLGDPVVQVELVAHRGRVGVRADDLPGVDDPGDVADVIVLVSGLVAAGVDDGPGAVQRVVCVPGDEVPRVGRREVAVRLGDGQDVADVVVGVRGTPFRAAGGVRRCEGGLHPVHRVEDRGGAGAVGCGGHGDVVVGVVDRGRRDDEAAGILVLR